MSSSLSTLSDLLTRVQFLTGLIAGGVALAALATLRSKRSTWGWGLAFGAVTITAVHISYARRLGLTAGLILLGIGGWLLDTWQETSRSRALGWTIIGLGAVTVSIRGGLPDVAWIQVATPIGITGVGLGVREWRYLPSHSLLGALVAISSFGVWITVPDTEAARVLMGASIPMALGTTTPVRSSISTPGAFVVAGVFAWIGATGGEMRHGSIVGAWACLGALALWPAIRSRLVDLPSKWLIAGGHATFVFFSARLFGLWETALMAAIGVASLVLATYLVLTRLKTTWSKGPPV